MSQENLKSKQELLKSEIIDKNYDKDKFLEFCMSKNNKGGDDLTKWSLNELSEIIDQFQKTEQSKTQENSPVPSQPSQDNLSSISKKAQEIKADIAKIQTMKSNETFLNQQVLTCKKLEKTELNDKTIEVIIRNPKSSDASFLQSTYITYEVLTESLQWLVRRRFSDFEWLRTILVKCFPRIVVPPLPGKKMGKRRFENDFVAKRMAFLQKFINSVMGNENFKTSEALIAFLSMIDRNQFDAKMRELTSYQPSQYTSDARTLSGKLVVIDDAEQEVYYSNIINYFKVQRKIYENLNYNLKNFYKSIQAASNSLGQVAQDFESLHSLNVKVLMKEEIVKTYEELGYFFNNWKRILYNQNQIIKERIKDFFKYIKMEGNSYSELINSREALKARYKAEYERIKAKKEKLWKTKDISQWEIVDMFNKVDRSLLFTDREYAFSVMCTKDTSSLDMLHKQLGYANQMNMDELRKIINVYSVKFVDNVKAFTEEFYPSLTDGISVWSALNSYI